MIVPGVFGSGVKVKVTSQLCLVENRIGPCHSESLPTVYVALMKKNKEGNPV